MWDQKEQLVIQRYHHRKPADLPQLESLLTERLQPVHSTVSKSGTA
jgi:iron-sulfur cluster repair protein YtfE (RIC family)